ncbi:hypothetical protein ACFV06_13515 [Streptomyces sp. NPDC059618]|uniref:hypothetical protein n=1 Tax=Streptomyces sp. NPDC059618 TaxID=3346887 RepID=UPI0036B04904
MIDAGNLLPRREEDQPVEACIPRKRVRDLPSGLGQMDERCTSRSRIIRDEPERPAQSSEEAGYNDSPLPGRPRYTWRSGLPS